MPSSNAPLTEIEIAPDHLRTVRDILRRLVPGCEVWVFGSRVAGRAKRASDLDLAVRGAAPLDFDTLTRLGEAFSESDLPWRVDVVDWGTASPQFRTIIQANHAVIQQAEPIDPADRP